MKQLNQINPFLHNVPYLYKISSIRDIEEQYNASYMGPWSIKDKHGNWIDTVVEVFYVENPDRSKGHTNYFGIYTHRGETYICDASSAFSETINGVMDETTGRVIVSRYQHDFVEHGEIFIDGGRIYLRQSIKGISVKVSVTGKEFKIEVIG